MPTAPTPDDPRSLTDRERTILAGIEANLRTADPGLARELSRGPTQPLDLATAARLTLISLAVLAGITALVVVPPRWWPVLLGLVTAFALPHLMARALQSRKKP